MPDESRWNAVRRRARHASQFWLAHPILPMSTLVAGVAGIVAVVQIAPRRFHLDEPQAIIGWGVPALLLGGLVAVLGLITLIMALQTRFGESRQERVGRLTTALEEAMRVVAEISAEIEDGTRRLEELEKQTDVQRRLANLTPPEAAAVRDALKEELGRERSRGLWRDLAMMLLGALIGAVVSYVLARVLGAGETDSVLPSVSPSPFLVVRWAQNGHTETGYRRFHSATVGTRIRK